jgi:hypothetical protein
VCFTLNSAHDLNAASKYRSCMRSSVINFGISGKQSVSDLLTSPVSLDVKMGPDILQLKLIDLQSDTDLKNKFISMKTIEYFRMVNGVF